MSQKDLSKTIPYGDLGIIPLRAAKQSEKKWMITLLAGEMKPM